MNILNEVIYKRSQRDIFHFTTDANDFVKLLKLFFFKKYINFIPGILVFSSAYLKSRYIYSHKAVIYDCLITISILISVLDFAPSQTTKFYFNNHF